MDRSEARWDIGGQQALLPPNDRMLVFPSDDLDRREGFTVELKLSALGRHVSFRLFGGRQ